MMAADDRKGRPYGMACAAPDALLYIPPFDTAIIHLLGVKFSSRNMRFSSFLAWFGGGFPGPGAVKILDKYFSFLLHFAEKYGIFLLNNHFPL